MSIAGFFILLAIAIFAFYRLPTFVLYLIKASAAQERIQTLENQVKLLA